MADTKVYTRGGDSGETSMLSGERVSKGDPHIASVGDLDELSVALGFARISYSHRHDLFLEIQQYLYKISAFVSYTGTKHAERFQLDPVFVIQLEKLIDEIQETLPPLKDFIYPGQSEAGCRLHLARVTARRAERTLAELPPEKRNAAMPYINRLSDLLFVIAREADRSANVDEVSYRQSE